MVQTADNPAVSPAAEQHFILQIASSELLPELDLSLLKRCLLFASPLDGLEEFSRGTNNPQN